jgi:CO/xanthine dehydrogenase Mo-binding subunit
MNLSGNITNGIGQPVRRKEDFRLLTGRGSFAEDVHLPELAHAVIVRSPHAHAHIASVDKTAALGSPGLLAVLTGRDYVADGLAPIPHGAGLMGRPDVAARVRGFAVCAGTWVEISVRGTSFIRNTRSSPGPRAGLADR